MFGSDVWRAITAGLLSEVPEVLENYFNWEAWTRDLNFDDWTENSPNGGVFVFRPM